jgi:hypothetical protein
MPDHCNGWGALVPFWTPVYPICTLVIQKTVNQYELLSVLGSDRGARDARSVHVRFMVPLILWGFLLPSSAFFAFISQILVINLGLLRFSGDIQVVNPGY